MAGVEWIWIKGSDAEFIGLPAKVAAKLMTKLHPIMTQIIADAVLDARARSADRVLTGAMISAIEGEVRGGAGEWAGRFGFLGEQQDYFIFQTVTGFHHWLSHEMIEPTFALRDAGEAAKAKLVAAVAAAVASI